MSNFYPVNQPFLDEKEKIYLLECIETGWISSEGPFVKEFEEKFAARMGRKYGVAVCNGSAALTAAVAACELEPGSEVILPAFTIISCASAVVQSGLKPVLIDSDPVTWNMDVRQIENKITDKTKAIMPVHIYGLPVDLDPVLSLAKKHNLIVIEDAAEMIGQTYKDKPCGSFGDMSIVSFYPNKHVTTGEGGMVLTDNAEYRDRCESLRNLCFQKERRFVHEKLGWNLRMTNLQAAVGLAQLEKLDGFINKKREMGTFYSEQFREIPDIELPPAKTDYAENIYWVYGILLSKELTTDAAEVMSLLREEGIGTRPFFYPMHRQPVFRKMGLFQGETFPVSEYLADKGFYIPSGLNLKKPDLKIIAEKVKTVLRKIT